jgi:hypothetical protein
VSSEQVAEYRRMAAECLAAAQAISDSEVKIQWLALAERWKSLADTLEKSEAQDDPDQGPDST